MFFGLLWIVIGALLTWAGLSVLPAFVIAFLMLLVLAMMGAVG